MKCKKNIFSIAFLMLLLLITTNVFAKENVTLRNDIEFGDSIETVKEKEVYELKNEEQDEDDPSKTTLKYNGSVANVDGVDIYYLFENDKLVEMKYDLFAMDFNKMLNPDLIIEQYTDILLKLKEKYGIEFDTENPDVDSAFHTSLYDYYLEESEFEKTNPEDVKVINFNGVVIEGEKYYTKLETFSWAMAYGEQKDKVQVNPYIAYHVIPLEEIEEYNSAKDKMQQNYDNDL